MSDLVVYVHLLETRTGLWCPTCLLPSAITVITCISTSPTAPPPTDPDPMLNTMGKTWCADCGRDVP
jgi:hypothetical protein